LYTKDGYKNFGRERKVEYKIVVPDHPKLRPPGPVSTIDQGQLIYSTGYIRATAIFKLGYPSTLYFIEVKYTF